MALDRNMEQPSGARMQVEHRRERKGFSSKPTSGPGHGALKWAYTDTNKGTEMIFLVEPARLGT